MHASTKNKLAFIAGVKAKYPALYNAAKIKGLSGLGETSAEIMARQDKYGESSGYGFDYYLNQMIDFFKQVGPAYISTQQAKQCLDINADRARNGLAPIDCANSGLAPQVSVGISPDIKTLAYVGLGILGVWLFTRKGR